MSNIVIYLPNESLGKQGGMERATHQLAAMLAGEGHRVTLLCRNKTGWGKNTCLRRISCSFPQPSAGRKNRISCLTLSGKEKLRASLTRRKAGLWGGGESSGIAGT